MIPVKLRLRNFMCYRDGVPELHLEGLHVACLCGPNGAGKSALLDSMTWALWGKARAKSDDDLITIGRDEMEVELDFLSQGASYRIVRKRSRGAGRRPGKTLLEFQALSGSESAPITQGTLRETQQRIVETLRMDYDTFINSAFLVQGRADEFTLKTADKRKEVLAEILDLAYYDAIAGRARDEARHKQGEAEALRATIGEYDVELATRGEREERTATAKRALAETESERSTAQAALDGLKKQVVVLETKEREFGQLKERAAGLQREQADLETTVAAAKAERAGYEARIEERVAIEAGFKRFEAAAREKDRLEEMERRSLQLALDKAELEGAITQARSKAEADLEREREAFTEMERRAGGLAESRDAVSQAEGRLADLEPLRRQRDELRGRVEKSTRMAGELEAQNKQLRAEMDEIKEKMELLRAGSGVCPLCETPLSEDRCEGVLEEYESRGKAKGDAHRENQAQRKALEEAEKAQRAEADGIDVRLRSEEPAMQAEIGGLKRALADAEEAVRGLPERRSQMEEAEKRLEGAVAEEKERLEQVAEQIAELDFDPVALETARADFQSAQPFEAKLRELREAERLMPGVVERLGQAETSLQGRAAEIEALRKEEQALEPEVAGLPEARSRSTEAEAAAAEIDTRRGGLEQEVGAAEADLARLDAIAEQRAERGKALAAASDEQSVFDELAAAFGRRGVQALIIETAIPEIEEEANRLLGRMTDNRMHLTLETQSDYRSREGARETLDIRIADELGVRGYELFSGGEAFRINLALRIALSRVLARRAGAPLPTLFIDEGFGTQDPGGRDRIVDALNAIRDDFERIIVITHIEELKEQFPARIQVEKGPEGATFSLA